MKRKMLSMLLAAVMLTGLLAGCGSDANESKESDKPTQSESSETSKTEESAPPTLSPKEQMAANIPGGVPDLSGVTIHLLTRTSQNTELTYDDILPVYRQIEELTGVELVWNSTDAEYGNFLTTRLLSGEPLDIFWVEGTDGNAVLRYIEEEIAYNITKAYDVAPNIQKYYTELSPSVAKSHTYLDGGIYCIPNAIYDSTEALAKYRVEEQSLVYRKDIAEELGFTEAPLTIDDWYKLLSAVKKAYPEMIPFNSNGIFGLWGQNLNAFAAAYGIRNNLAVWTEWFVDENGEVDFQGDNDEMLAFVTEMNKWYKEGLLGFTAGGGNRDGLLLQNIAFADENCATWGLFGAIDQLRSIDADASFAHAPLPTKEGYQTTYMGRDVYMNYWVVVDNDDEQSKAVCKFIDFAFFSEYGKLSQLLGCMGEDTWYFDEKGEVVYNEDYINAYAADTSIVTKQRGAGGWTVPQCYYAFDPLIAAREKAWDKEGEEYLALKENAKWATQVQQSYLTPAYKDGYFTENEKAIANRYSADLSSYVSEQLCAFIVGDRPLEEWENYCQELIDTYHLLELTVIRN